MVKVKYAKIQKLKMKINVARFAHNVWKWDLQVGKNPIFVTFSNFAMNLISKNS